MKAALWEEAKGKLRAIVAVEGACMDGLFVSETDHRYKFETISEDVEAFIKAFEVQEHNL